MHRLFLALVCASMAWLGCAPALRYECRGGASNAAEWHTVEASGMEAAQNDNGFGECREPLVETVVGVEYAGATTRHCAGMMVIHAKWNIAPKWPWYETIEVFTDTGLSPRDIVASIQASRLDWYGNHRSKSIDLTVMTIAPVYLAPFNDVVVRCWTGDEPPRSVRDWPSEGTYTAGGGIYRWTDIVWTQRTRLAEVYAPQKCQEWSTITDSIMWTPKDGVARMICHYELHIRGQYLSSDGHWELGAIQYPHWQGHKMCGPATYAASAMRRILHEEVPRQIPSATNWQEVDFVGACWNEKDPKPAAPTNWSGRNVW